MPTQVYSQNIIAKMIQQHVGSAYSGGDIYNQLREMVDSGVLENEGVFIVSQETKQGSYGKAYSFDNCEKVIEIWSQLYAKDDATADNLQKRIADIFGVHPVTIHYILVGKSWAHVEIE